MSMRDRGTTRTTEPTLVVFETTQVLTPIGMELLGADHDGCWATLYLAFEHTIPHLVVPDLGPVWGQEVRVLDLACHLIAPLMTSPSGVMR